jgi:crotonobetainyl-CoA:carnitine CoA-transferase CaiB-like acyl-CoA transferase
MSVADMGAEVIKIEAIEKGAETRGHPPFRGPLSRYYIALNRNKQSVRLDLKSPEGVEIAKALAAHSDIVLENFRPGMIERLSLGH